MFDQTHPILLPSALLHPSELYLLFSKTHRVHTVLPVCAWAWGHLAGHGRPLWDNIPGEN